jgi:acetyl-CoA C-acetyltransferase
MLLRSRTGHKFGSQQLVDAMIQDGLWCPTEQKIMGELAEATARSCGVDRAAQDQFAAESHRRAAEAIARDSFAAELVPVSVPGKPSALPIARDEGPRADVSPQKLGQLPPAFSPDGTITAGNASQISDGAAAVVVVNERLATEARTPWKARIVASAVSGVEPRDLFLAPVSAIQQVLSRAKLHAKEIDLFEINEAFAAQSLACQRKLDLDPARVNVLGGAIALGHPIGASGGRVLITLLHALVERRLLRGLASLCLGGGNAVAMIVEMQ